MTRYFPRLELALLWCVVLACLPCVALASPVLGVELKSFAVLGGSTVTSAGKSTLIGSVGVSPGTAVTGFGFGEGTYTGSMHLSDATANAAHAQLATAMTNLRKMGPGTPIAGILDGLTLSPGVYTLAAAASNLAANKTLILDGGGNANAYWVFHMPSTLITDVGSVVKVINAGAGAGVYWVVGSSATMAGKTFAGNILAGTSITINDNVDINCGRVLALDGAVTMIADIVNSVDCTGSGVEGSAGLSGGLDVPADGSAPTPLPPPASGSSSCTLGLSVPNHVAETAQTVTVTAFDSAGSGKTVCFAGESKMVNFACTYANPASGTLPLRMGANVALASDSTSPCSAGGANLTLAFDPGGVAYASLIYADAGQMTLKASYLVGNTAGTVISASSTFIVAPARFGFSAVRQSAAPGVANPAAANDQGAQFIKAGEPFSATVSALNRIGNPVANFGREAAPEQIRLSTSLLAPAGGRLPALRGSFGPFAGGAVSANDLAWDEVGIIELTASLANGYGYLGTSAAPSNLAVTGGSGAIGRFVPAHFDTAITAGVPMPCPRARVCPAAGFVYAAQPFGVMVTARNLAGSTTANYNGPFARGVTLAAWSAPGSTALSNPPAAPGGNQLRTPGVAASAFVQGMASVTSPAYVFAAAFPVTVNLAPPTDIYLRASDTDGVTSLRAASVEGGVSVVSGRLQVVNNYGSELLALPMPVNAQFWDGARFINSSTDSLSVFNRSNITMSNCSRNLNTGSGCKPALAVAAAPTVLTLANGAGRFTLAAPGAGNTGSVDLRITAPPYLPSTTGRATFGIYNSGPVIYMRELY